MKEPPLFWGGSTFFNPPSQSNLIPPPPIFPWFIINPIPPLEIETHAISKSHTHSRYYISPPHVAMAYADFPRARPLATAEIFVNPPRRAWIYKLGFGLSLSPHQLPSSAGAGGRARGKGVGREGEGGGGRVGRGRGGRGRGVGS